MGTTYKPGELKIIILRAPDGGPRTSWQLWVFSPASPGGQELVASCAAETYKLACAAAGEAFDRLTAPREQDVMERMKEYQQKVCGPDWQAEAQRATQRYNDLLATVTAALAELDAFPGKYEYGQGVSDAIKVFRRHLTPKPAEDPAIVRALQEALRAYREVSHDRVNGDDVKAMAAAIAAYETEKAKP
jgi:hypothetical protein